MADLLIWPGRSRYATPRIDLTPMVDLGFLLLTFFIMTTTLSDPKALEIQMPYQPPGTEEVHWLASSAITLLPAAGHKVFYYEGVYEDGTRLRDAGSEEELRTLLQRKQRALQHREQPRERALQVLIKADQGATTEDIIRLFDDMSLLQVRHFALVDISAGEAGQVKAMLQ